MIEIAEVIPAKIKAIKNAKPIICPATPIEPNSEARLTKISPGPSLAFSIGIKLKTTSPIKMPTMVFSTMM